MSLTVSDLAPGSNFEGAKMLSKIFNPQHSTLNIKHKIIKGGNAMLPALRKNSTLPGLMDEFFGRDVFPGFFFDVEKRMSTPAVNIIEGKDDYRIEVAAPGLDKKDFKIDLDNNVLTISSEREEKHEEKDDRFMRREFNYTSFSRSFTLPESVEGDRITAKHSEGVLTVVIPKREEAKQKPARTIKIL